MGLLPREAVLAIFRHHPLSMMLANSRRGSMEEIEKLLAIAHKYGIEVRLPVQ
jgi:hypothetical protein